jgi:LCP family protein required for cell wall assembly
MDPQLKKLNELLFKSKPKRNLWPVFRKIIIFVLLIAVLASLSLFTPLFKEREIVISGQKGGKTIINLGYLGLIFPSTIKNKERVNLLFLGVPGEGHHGPELTDSIIILNSTPKAENPIGISIPRDLFIKNPDKNIYTKVNAIYQDSGTETIKNVLKEITDLDIDYFIILDLQGVKKLIDLVDGIDVLNENDIYDPQFPGLNDSYTAFSLKKGIHHLDGETALKYIRTRHQPGGDFGRIKRQQQVINILKDKIFSLNVFWNFPTLLKVWKTLNKHTETNVGLTDIKYAWNLAKKTNFDEIKFITLSNQPNEEIQLLVSEQTTLGGKTAYILKPKAGLNNYSEIKDYIQGIINSPYK